MITSKDIKNKDQFIDDFLSRLYGLKEDINNRYKSVHAYDKLNESFLTEKNVIESIVKWVENYES